MNAELITLTKILPEIATYLEGLDNTEDAETVRKAAAMLGKLAEQKPVAWCNLDLWNDGGYEAQDCFVDKPGLTCFDTPLYAAPVAAITADRTQDTASLSKGPSAHTPDADNSLVMGGGCGAPALTAEQKAEVMRLADEYARRYAQIASGRRPCNVSESRAALSAYLDKIGGRE